MNQELIDIRDQQKKSWDKFSPGWKKWDEVTMRFMLPVGDAIIDAIQPFVDAKILDIASGTGEPALTIAALPGVDKVVMTDISEEMLIIAVENAEAKNLDNIESVVCDVCELPFKDESFDAVSCRFGYMFFPDMQLATNEIYRVLKPGGKMATAVWNVPDRNFWVTATMSVINKNMELPKPPEGAPGMFRCCQPGQMKTLLENAGFKNIIEQEVPTKLDVGYVETYWQMMNEVAAPIVAALSKADDAMQQKIKEEVLANVLQKYKDGEVAIDASTLVFSAEK
ncbi:MAG: methyltransferase domain-containing protein [Ferruginibacter sp.]